MKKIMFLLCYIQQVRASVVQRVTVVMMTDFFCGGEGYESVHVSAMTDTVDLPDRSRVQTASVFNRNPNVLS